MFNLELTVLSEKNNEYILTFYTDSHLYNKAVKLKTGLKSDILIEKCKVGNTKAQFEIFELYVKQMYNVAYRICGNKFDAEDALQDAFVKAFFKIASYKATATFGAWLKRIVVNQSIAQLRMQKHSFQSIDEFNTAEKLTEEEVELEEEMPIDIVKDAIASLPKSARLVFTLKAIEEYKFREIAEMLNISESNCKVQYHRSKKLLNEKLKRVVI